MATTQETRQEVRAEAKWVRVSPRKARVVVDHIRGRTVPEARTVLAFTTRAAAREIEKVLRSAVANAEANHGLDGDTLLVSAAYVDEGPTIKRWRPRARGRVSSIYKRTCHITVRLAENPKAAARPRRPEATAASSEATPDGATETPARAPRPRKEKVAAEVKSRPRTPARKKETTS